MRNWTKRGFVLRVTSDVWPLQTPKDQRPPLGSSTGAIHNRCPQKGTTRPFLQAQVRVGFALAKEPAQAFGAFIASTETLVSNPLTDSTKNLHLMAAIATVSAKCAIRSANPPVPMRPLSHLPTLHRCSSYRHTNSGGTSEHLHYPRVLHVATTRSIT